MNHIPNNEVKYYPTLRYYSILRGMVVTFYMPVDVFLVTISSHDVDFLVDSGASNNFMLQ